MMRQKQQLRQWRTTLRVRKNRPAIRNCHCRGESVEDRASRASSLADIPWKRYLWKPAIREFPADSTIRKRQEKEKGTAGRRNRFEKTTPPPSSRRKISLPARWWTNIGRTCLTIFSETDRCCVSNFTLNIIIISALVVLVGSPTAILHL